MRQDELDRPEEPVRHRQQVSAANGKGNFKTTMKVEACPAKAQPPGLSQTCFIGVEQFGIDNVTLRPHASIVVTFP